MPAAPPKFADILTKLEKHYGRLKPEHPTDPFSIILWEKMGYLVEDSKRALAFKALKQHVGIDPVKILATRLPVLEEICKIGGIHADKRAQRLHECSAIVMDDFDGTLRNALKLSPKQAIKAICRFPYVGEPGAEKVLLFTGAYPILAMESNSLRVLVRLGYGKESKNYTKMYRSTQEALVPEIPQDCATLIRANLVLRRHGQTLCKTTMPQCGGCPLLKNCAHARKLTALRPKPV